MHKTEGWLITGHGSRSGTAFVAIKEHDAAIDAHMRGMGLKPDDDMRETILTDSEIVPATLESDVPLGPLHNQDLEWGCKGEVCQILPDDVPACSDGDLPRTTESHVRLAFSSTCCRPSENHFHPCWDDDAWSFLLLTE